MATALGKRRLEAIREAKNELEKVVNTEWSTASQTVRTTISSDIAKSYQEHFENGAKTINSITKLLDQLDQVQEILKSIVTTTDDFITQQEKLRTK